ncbi:MAG: ferredoxin [Planctomycetes bacterium]|nr:ferredoxin [Planctomycetota bacterium]
MTNAPEPQPENVPGRFYVDTNCIDCGLCPNVAPNHFAENDAGTHTFVYAQPRTPGEEAECEEAAATCPTQSIRNDGAEMAQAG